MLMQTFNTIYANSQHSRAFNSQQDFLIGYNAFSGELFEALDEAGVPIHVSIRFINAWLNNAHLEQRAADAQCSIKTVQQFLNMVYESAVALVNDFAEVPTFDRQRIQASLSSEAFQMLSGLNGSEMRAFILSKASN